METPQVRAPAPRPRFRRSLRRTLLFGFLAMALIPAAALSLISYRNAHDSLIETVQDELTSVAELKTEYIRFFFLRMLTDLDAQASAPSNARFLAGLRGAYAASGEELGEFVGSYPWELLVDEYGADLTTFRRIYDYYDVFLIGAEGDILFTVVREPDLGANLFRGELSETKFARACQAALSSGHTTFSDFERYAPSQGAVAGFLASVLLDERGNKIGLMAVQLPVDRIDALMQQRAGLGRTGESYLVGADLRMRSNTALGAKETILGEPIDTVITRAWSRDHVQGHADPGDHREEVLAYEGPNGRRVLGLHTQLEVAGVPLGLIAETEEAEALAPIRELRILSLVLLIGTVLLVSVVATVTAGRLARPIARLSDAARRVSDGDLDQEIEIGPRNEIGELGSRFHEMVASLREATRERELSSWMKTGQAELGERMRGEKGVAALARDVITYLAQHLEAHIGAIYLVKNPHRLQLVGSYAFHARKGLTNEIELGQGLVGQAALEGEPILLTQVPADYLAVSSGLGEAPPRNILVRPISHESELKGVIELGSLEALGERCLAFLDLVEESIAIAIDGALSRQRLQELLETSQAQSEELQSQTEELRVQQEELQTANSELEEKTLALQQSEEELQVTNEELEEKTRGLERQKSALEVAKRGVEDKAEELEEASRYKSEFLANMSHELRTPLNALLILAESLSDNEPGNLSARQVEDAQVIHSCGQELLTLINDLLDLSKVEAGKLDIHLETVDLRVLMEGLRKQFTPLTRGRGLELRLDAAAGAPPALVTDGQRLEQILRNLLSNAVKFTQSGSITLRIHPPGSGATLADPALAAADAVAFSVTDTGIGISEEKRSLIFESFQQADGSTSRKYGGTGLGLTISRELARLLGGEIHVESRLEHGSTFTLYLPAGRSAEPEETSAAPSRAEPAIRAPARTGDSPEEADRDARTILVIEDDRVSARLLSELAERKGFQCLLAQTGRRGLELADERQPDAILLDRGLPDMEGSAVFEELRAGPSTRHIPVFIISGREEDVDFAAGGALGYLQKPVSVRAIEELLDRVNGLLDSAAGAILLMGGSPDVQEALANLVDRLDVEVTAVDDAEEALRRIRRRAYDCVVLDLDPHDDAGFDLLRRLDEDESAASPPIVVHTGEDLSAARRRELERHARSVVVADGASRQRLVDEVSLLLQEDRPAPATAGPEAVPAIGGGDPALAGRRVLLVDDDERNTYALGQALERRGLEVALAENGQVALEALEGEDRVDLIIMDIMMPVMDGYEAIRRIRADQRLADLPVLALTAKAMADDRARCIEAGANDYLTKPVDVDHLVSLIRVWLSRP